MKKYPYKIDIPVFLVFFNRPDCLKIVFESIKQARPSKLFLCQDGARDGNLDDIENIKKCQEIVDNIDWDCEVYRDYSDKNLGCGMRIYTGITKAFDVVDRLVVIEDDIKVHQDFFPFCCELLEKYKDDQRIKMISGMNHLGVYTNTSDDYFFTNSGAIWGWATWRRAWSQVEYEMPYIKDSIVVNTLKNSLYKKRKIEDLINLGEVHLRTLSQGEKLSSWSYQHGMAAYLNNQLNIVPKYNLISNIGLTDDSTHAVNNLNKIPKGLQKVFFADMYSISFPLKHPKYMINDYNYEKEVDKVMGGRSITKYFRKIEGICRQMIFGDWKKIIKKATKMIVNVNIKER